MDTIEDGNKVMLALYDNTQEIQVRAKAQILEVDKFYSATSMEIFTDNSMDELASIETIVQYFKSSFEGVRDHKDIHTIFKN